MKWALGASLASNYLIACCWQWTTPERERGGGGGDKYETTDTVDPKSKWTHSSENVVPVLHIEKPSSAVLIDAIL